MHACALDHNSRPAAVNSLDNAKVVYIMENNKPVKRTVQTGGTLNGLLVVEKGLAEGDLLIIPGSGSEAMGSELQRE